MVRREFGFALRDRAVLFTLLLAFCASVASVVVGHQSVNEERQLLKQLRQTTSDERAHVVAASGDVGGMGYDAFHLTYDPPSSLAFAAVGTRDSLPFRHRIRMLALEGQIYEADVGNPELSLNGRLDYAFIAAVLMPLLLIFLLHDIEAGERRAARHDLLCVTAAEGQRLFTLRALLRGLMLWGVVVIPFVPVAIIEGASATEILAVLSATAFSMLFWLAVCRAVVGRISAGPTCAVCLLGVWLALAVLLPAGGQLLARSLVEVPQGGELLLTQREAVNDAWDLPKESTMEPFMARHPQWAAAKTVSRPFEWKWYYAFQQVGDQTVEDQSQRLREGIAERDRMMSYLSILSPPLLAERWMNRTAETDLAGFRRYETCVRTFHTELRDYYYSMLFGEREFDDDAKAAIPDFVPCSGNKTA
ncbi:MAG: DUF3526 domain-containing protein [Lysobacterales bacterium]